MKQILRIIPQKGSYKDNKDDYTGMVGEIEVCNACCRGALRVQFLDIGNNTRLDNFNLDKCKFFIVDNV